MVHSVMHLPIQLTKIAVELNRYAWQIKWAGQKPFITPSGRKSDSTGHS